MSLLVRSYGVYGVEVAERKTIQEEWEQGGGEAVGKHCRTVRAVDLGTKVFKSVAIEDILMI